MKAIFLNIAGVLVRRGDFLRNFDGSYRGSTVVSVADVIDPVALGSLSMICESVQNVWFVLGSETRSVIGLDDWQRIVRLCGFRYAHRFFDFTVRRSRNGFGLEVYSWLRGYASSNEVNSFAVVSPREVNGLLGPYSTKTDEERLLTKSEALAIVGNFNSHEYRLGKIWSVVTSRSL